MKKSFSTLLITLSLFLLTSGYVSAANNGYDQICQISKQILTDPSNKSLNQGQKLILIDKKVHKSITSKTVIDAYESYVYANSDIRYIILKKIAEQELKRSWDCPILKTFNF